MRRGIALALAFLLCGTMPALGLTPGGRVVFLSKPGPGAILSQTATLVAAMTVPPSPSRLRVINNTMTQLVQSGLLAKMDFLYFFGAATEQAALLNWAAPASFAGTNSGTCVFTPNFGYTGDGTACHIITNFTPSTNGVNWTLNAASIGAWGLQNASNTGVFYGESGATNRLTLSRGVGGLSIRLNDLTTLNSSATGSNTLMVGNRSGASARQIYAAGTNVGSDTTAATALQSSTVWLLGSNTTFTAASFPLGAAFGGGSLSASDVATLTQIVGNYVRAVQQGS